jgi:hypothetical protein
VEEPGELELDSTLVVVVELELEELWTGGEDEEDGAT